MSTYPPPTGRILVRKLADATKSCVQPARAYGTCILESYKDISRDACVKEFGQFKLCVQGVMKRKW
ncbi:hypothetical protein CALVIDRAFT_538539 [Calocera viscosa TUFC12733]|uniref:IMS import disulfide relay-system CHCH-CHCH-like Cx9C domain-containing protein n=1 Tax=Calocera viscosa (strain TUFC12733) TaxID=1330018 RepID=A0A167KW47_CALVF|nr:hypothetical protein CALVIDRAFT_538539 [Calocera viscosa TUFC12733]